MPIWLQVLCIVLCGILSALFSGLSLGIMMLDTLQLNLLILVSEKNKKELNNAKNARKILPLRKNTNEILVTFITANIMVNCAFSLLLSEMSGGLYSFIISTIFITIFGEIIPQSICSRHGLAIGGFFIPLIYCLRFFLYIFVKPVSFLLDRFVGKDVLNTYDKKQLKALVDMHKNRTNILHEDEAKILVSALEFSQYKVIHIMTDIDYVFGVDYNSVINYETLKNILKSGFSRIPILDRNRPDCIVGLVHIKDLVNIWFGINRILLNRNYILRNKKKENQIDKLNRYGTHNQIKQSEMQEDTETNAETHTETHTETEKEKELKERELKKKETISSFKHLSTYETRFEGGTEDEVIPFITKETMDTRKKTNKQQNIYKNNNNSDGRSGNGSGHDITNNPSSSDNNSNDNSSNSNETNETNERNEINRKKKNKKKNCKMYIGSNYRVKKKNNNKNKNRDRDRSKQKNKDRNKDNTNDNNGVENNNKKSQLRTTKQEKGFLKKENKKRNNSTENETPLIHKYVGNNNDNNNIINNNKSIPLTNKNEQIIMERRQQKMQITMQMENYKEEINKREIFERELIERELIERELTERENKNSQTNIKGKNIEKEQINWIHTESYQRMKKEKNIEGIFDDIKQYIKILNNNDIEIPIKHILKHIGRYVYGVDYDENIWSLLNFFKSATNHIVVVRKVIYTENEDPKYAHIGIITLEDVIEILLQEEITDEFDFKNVKKGIDIPIDFVWKNSTTSSNFEKNTKETNITSHIRLKRKRKRKGRTEGRNEGRSGDEGECKGKRVINSENKSVMESENESESESESECSLKSENKSEQNKRLKEGEKLEGKEKKEEKEEIDGEKKENDKRKSTNKIYGGPVEEGMDLGVNEITIDLEECNQVSWRCKVDNKYITLKSQLLTYYDDSIVNFLKENIYFKYIDTELLRAYIKRKKIEQISKNDYLLIENSFLSYAILLIKGKVRNDKLNSSVIEGQCFIALEALGPFNIIELFNNTIEKRIAVLKHFEEKQNKKKYTCIQKYVFKKKKNISNINDFKTKKRKKKKRKKNKNQEILTDTSSSSLHTGKSNILVQKNVNILFKKWYTQHVYYNRTTYIAESPCHFLRISKRDYMDMITECYGNDQVDASI